MAALSSLIIILTLFLGIRDGVMEAKYRTVSILKYIPQLGWQWWLVIGTFSLLALALEGAYRAHVNSYSKLRIKHKQRIKEIRTAAQLNDIHSQTRALAGFKNSEPESPGQARIDIFSKNEFSDFRITFDVDKLDVLIAEVWYFYDGALGGDDIFIEMEPTNNGASLVGTTPNSYSRNKVEIIRHKALAKNIIYSYVSFSSLEREEKSTHIQISLLHNKTYIYQQLFPYSKKWNVKA